MAQLLIILWDKQPLPVLPNTDYHRVETILAANPKPTNLVGCKTSLDIPIN
jgi:hypothetical protein